MGLVHNIKQLVSKSFMPKDPIYALVYCGALMRTGSLVRCYNVGWKEGR